MDLTDPRTRFRDYVLAREHPEVMAHARAWVDEALAEAVLAETAPPLSVWLEASAPSLGDPQEFAAAALAFHAPLGLSEGSWLQAVALAGNGHRASVAALFAAYLALLGEDATDSPATAYRAALTRTGVDLPRVDGERFAHDLRIGEPALTFASLQLALGMHSMERLPEILGYTFAYLRSDAPWRLLALPPARRAAVLADMDAHARRALVALMAETADADALPARVWSGAVLYRKAEAAYRAAWSAFTARKSDVAEQVAELFRRKAPYARGYHGAVDLGGRPLDAWFADRPFDAARFLAALAASPFLAGTAGARPFDRLTGFGGPMFGVFDTHELALIDAWCDRGKPVVGANLFARDDSRNSRSAFQPRSKPPRPGANVFARADAARELSTRALYHKLLSGQLTKAIVEQARRWVERQLPRGGWPFDYTPQALAQWVDHQYARRAVVHRPFAGRAKLTRKEYVWGIRQFAPLILVDGCWLQHMGEAVWQGDGMRRWLFRIYADELGAGRVERNHPNVYRALLDSVGVKLPDFDRLEFAHSADLLDAAFEPAVYLLAISLFPRRYLPEILGLNLAIELSGLGGQYLRLADELRHWGIDPAIVTLHQSIDTLAGGHAALAVEAIQAHLDEVAASAGEAAVIEHWRRIGQGYRSLESATRRFKWQLVFAFGRRFLLDRIARGTGTLLDGGSGLSGRSSL
jgi:hypothetical protein